MASHGIGLAIAMNMRTIFLSLIVFPWALLADTVVLNTGERIVGKVVPYGDFLIVGGKAGGEARVLDRILVDTVEPKPEVDLEVFLDLPPEGENPNSPSPANIRFYRTPEAKVRHLLDLSTRTVADSKDPAGTAKRAREVLKAMKGRSVEEELFAAVVPVCDAPRVKLALECLQGSDPKGMERRLVEVALAGGQDLCKVAAEEMKRRYGKCPAAVLGALCSPESGEKSLRAAAEVVGVLRDEAGIDALVTALHARGVRRNSGGLPHMAYVKTVKTEADPERHETRTRHEMGWVDEDFQFKEPDERILCHLVAVLEAIAGEPFKDLKDVDDWRRERQQAKAEK